MKNLRYIKRFRLFRASCFTIGILLRYMTLFLFRKILPSFIYRALLKRLNLRVSKKMRNYFFRLQGIYIKVGQFLSVMGNIFAPDLTVYLKELQDSVPPRRYEEILPLFLKFWKAPPEAVLDSFDPHPIASASLGQVYAGVYRGKKVAIKLLYPGIKEVMEKDLQILRALLGIVEFFFSSLDTSTLYNEFTEMILKEIDFNYEKAHLKKLQNLFSEEPDALIPDFIEELSCQDILVTHFIEGCKIDHLSCLAAQGHDPAQIARKLLDIYSEMIFKHGFFHSDPHPGNLIITPEGKIGIIDFGSADTIPHEIILMIRKLLKAFLFKDHAMIVQHIEDMGFLKPTADKEEMERIVYFILQKLSAFQVKDYQRMTLNQIYRIYNVKTLGLKFQQFVNQLQIPKNYLFLGRTMAILIGVVGKLDPHINIIEILLPHLKKFLIDKKENLKEVLAEELKANFHYVSRLPENIHKALETVNSGKIKMNLKELRPEVRKLYVLGHQMIYTLLAIAGGAFSIQFHLHGETVPARIFAYASAALGGILMISFFRNRKK